MENKKLFVKDLERMIYEGCSILTIARYYGITMYTVGLALKSNETLNSLAIKKGLFTTNPKSYESYDYVINLETKHVYISVNVLEKPNTVRFLSTSGALFSLNIKDYERKDHYKSFNSNHLKGQYDKIREKLYNDALSMNLLVVEEESLIHPVRPSEAFEWKVMATPREIHNKQQELLLIITI